MKKLSPPSSSPDRRTTGLHLRRTTLRQLTQVELGRVVAGHRREDQPGTTGIENDCNTKNDDW
ncbi:MAG TPA: hypothetical protein VK698_20605 [Kofleriaceae bacterium]|nr:hypothetical protein [Kofleriaceae bacterium]